METPEPKKSFWVVPFTVQVTRGLIRDQRSRRMTTAFALAVALLMVIAGVTVLRSWLDPHDHPWRFLFYWFACAWETLLVLLLALLDLLLARAQARQDRRRLNKELSKSFDEDASG